jgi:group II intron reverse transcriptase/maturase
VGLWWEETVIPSEPTTGQNLTKPAQLELDMQLSTVDLWQQIWSRANLLKAIQRIEKNNGAPGVDGMKANELRSWFHRHWPETQALLDAGHYKPRPVRLVTIPKPGGGTRNLGVPTVIDRLVQQAILQILGPIFDREFSESSFGFRPKRSAHQAVKAAQSYIDEGSRTVVEVDLDKFFDRVHHDVLMTRVSNKIADKQVLKLTGRFLRAGIMADGVKQPSDEGTPQGSPLSPLLANIMLDDLDKELERRGHRFVRYADDIRVFVKTKRSGERVLNSITVFVEKRLKLKVNQQKSKISPPSKAEMLGFGFWLRKGGTAIKISDGAKRRLKQRLREITKRSWGCSMRHRIFVLNRFIRSWMAYFGIADTNRVFSDLDEWLRRRIRQVFWKQWKKPITKRRMLASLGIPRQKAYEWSYSSKAYWRIAGSAPLQRALPNDYLHDQVGLVGLHQAWSRLRTTC